MKKMLLSAAAFLMLCVANAQISSLPATQDFTDVFGGDVGTNVTIYPNYTANEVQASTRIFRDEVVFNSAPAAIAAIPTGSFDGQLLIDFNLTNYSNVVFSFVAKSMLNGTGTRPSAVTASVSIDNGTTWIGVQQLGSFPNEDQAAFTNVSYSFPAEANNQAAVQLKIVVGTGEGGSGTRAKVVMDDFQFQESAVAQLALGSTALSFSQTVGTASQSQVVTLSGSNLTEGATLTVAAPFEISLSATTGYTTSLTVDQVSGVIASTNIYVRVNATQAGDVTGELVATGSGIETSTALAATVVETAATNPEPFDLSTGDYTFAAWPAESAAGTFPANMKFWTHATTDPTIDIAFNEDYTCLYNLTSRSRFSGQGDAGVSMVNTGNSQYVGVCDGTDPTQASGDTVANGRAGAVVLGLNTTGRQDVSVAWTGTTIAQNNRVYSLRIQYRIGAGSANANWTDIANGDDEFTQYVSGETGNTATFTTALPAEVNNQAEVQVRWVYNYIETGVTGSRAEIALDDVTVTSNVSLGTDEFSANTFAMYPNPASNMVSFTKPLAVTVYDFTGKAIYTSDKEISTLNVSGYSSGIYLVKTTSGAVKKLIVK